jgi:hypothetical protein
MAACPAVYYSENGSAIVNSAGRPEAERVAPKLLDHTPGGALLKADGFIPGSDAISQKM